MIYLRLQVEAVLYLQLFISGRISSWETFIFHGEILMRFILIGKYFSDSYFQDLATFHGAFKSVQHGVIHTIQHQY